MEYDDCCTNTVQGSRVLRSEARANVSIICRYRAFLRVSCIYRSGKLPPPTSTSGSPTNESGTKITSQQERGGPMVVRIHIGCLVRDLNRSLRLLFGLLGIEIHGILGGAACEGDAIGSFAVVVYYEWHKLFHSIFYVPSFLHLISIRINTSSKMAFDCG